jgi:hypothetical protein
MKKEDVIFERKEFLNLAGHNGMANIVANIIKSSYGRDNDNYRTIDCKLDFADCSRVVNMEINLDDEYSRENALHKVDVLIDVLTEFREALVKEGKYQARLGRRKRKKSKKNNEKNNNEKR